MNNEFKNKNDYSVVVFTPQKVLKYTYVHNLFNFKNFLNSSFGNWQYMNVYARRSGRFLKRFYNVDFVPPKIDNL